MKFLRVILISILFYSCSFDNNQKNTESQLDSLQEPQSDLPETSTEKNISSADTSAVLNFRDDNGLKQGKWIRKLKGEIIEIAHYKNDTLNGYFQSYEFGGGYEGKYENGQRQGIFLNWHVNKKSLLAVTLYKNDKQVWMGFPSADEHYLFLQKGFQIEIDSVFIQAPYENGETWYEGHFCLRPSNMNKGRLMTYPYGNHKIYFRNGKIRGIVDYSNEMIQEYDSKGNELYRTKFSDYLTHKQPNYRY